MTPKNERQHAEHSTRMTDAHRDFEKSLNLHAFFKVSDHAAGQDLVQETFMKTWKYLVKGGKIEMMKAFLYHVLNNLIVDQYRKKKTASLDVLLEKGYEPSMDDSVRLFNFLDGKEAILLIARLPLSYQKPMHMRYIEDLSLEEMSEKTGERKNTIAVKLHRGLEKLKVLYEHKA